MNGSEGNQQMAPLVSIVVPCHNEQESLPILFDKLIDAMRTMRSEDVGVESVTSADYASEGETPYARGNIASSLPRFEVVFVDDGSNDDTVLVIQQLETNNPCDFVDIKWLAFSRNFGKEAALYAGLKNAKGDFVVTMDADMQDPPELLPEMYRILMADDEYDDVATYRVSRTGEPHIRSFFARAFYKVMRRVSDIDVRDGARDFRFMRRRMVDAVLSLSEYNRFSKGIYDWVGFNTKWIPFENVERVAGNTSWNFFQLGNYALEGIVSFSTKPLQIASVSGVLFCLLAAIVLIFVIVRALMFGDPVAGWPSTISIILFIGGLQLLCMGIFGQYLAKSYLETKNRPIYIVRKSNID